MGHVMRFEYQEHWKTKDNRDFMERLAQKVVSGERVYGAPVEHPCIVPTCGKERLYASSECENHDEALNGPLGIIVAGRHRQVSLGRCMRCRVLVGSALNDSPVFVCPFHMMVPAGNDWLERYFHWNESIEQWTMACPVCFIRTHNAKQGEAWNLFVDHLARKHREVALAVA